MLFPSQSLDFEASSNQYASAADSASLSITGNLSIECWINFESLPTSSNDSIFVNKFSNSANNDSFFFGLSNDAGTYKFRFSTRNSGNTFRTVNVNWTPSTGTWYHVAVTYEASSADVKFYVDGVQQGTTQNITSTDIKDSTAPVNLATNDDAGGVNNFDGKMVLVRLWSSVRSSSDISTNKCGILGSTSNLAAEWTLNGKYTDNSGNSNTLTASNSPIFSTSLPSTCSSSTPEIARDNYKIGTKTANTSTITESFTNKGNVLVVFAVNSLAGGGAITSVTYNGVAMTPTGSTTTGASNVWFGQTYVLYNPYVGTADIVMTVPNSAGNVNSIVAISLTGAGSTQPDATDATPAFTATSYSDSITVAHANSWVAAVGYNSGAKFTTGTGILTKLADDADAWALTLADSNGVVSAGAQTYGMSGGANAPSMALAIAIATITSTNYTKTLTEAPEFSESLLKSTARALLQTVQTTDTFSRVWTIARTFTQTVNASASVLKTVGRALVEAITFGDTFVKGFIIASGPAYPGSAASVPVGAGTFQASWSNPTNALTSNNAYATASFVGDVVTSQRLQLTDFGFGIPSNATIAGISVSIERKKESTGTVSDLEVSLIQGGTVSGDNKADTSTAWPTSDGTASYGASDDLWGLSLSPSDINASNFGVSIRARMPNGVDPVALVDTATITVHYISQGNIFSETYEETVEFASSVLKTTSRTLLQSISASDTFARVWTAGRTLTEAPAIAAAVLKTAGRTLLQMATAADTVVKSTTRALTDTVTQAAAILRTVGRSLTDAIEAADTFTFARTLRRTFSDAIEAADAAVRSVARTMTDAFTKQDEITALRAQFGVFEEAAEFTDTMLRSLGRTITNAVALTDSVLRSTARTVSEAFRAADVRNAAPGRTLSDSPTFTDTVIRVPGKLLSEAVTATAAILRTIGRQLADSATAASSVLKSVSRPILEAIASQAAVYRATGRILSEAPRLTALALPVLLIARTLSESVEVLDTFLHRLPTKIRKGVTVLTTKLSKSAGVLATKAKDAMVLLTRNGKTPL